MSLINDALKRASEAQASAAQRPRGPKGIDDLPAPMTPVAARERPAWLPIAGIAVLIAVLLGASGYFFVKWWKERQSWQPYATEDIDEHGFPRTNKPVAKAVSPAPLSVVTNKPPVPAVTNPPLATNLVVSTNPVVATNVAVVTPTVEPAKTNPPVVVAVTNPPPPIPVPTPPVPKSTNPVVVVEVPTPPTSPVNPPTTTKGETNVASVTPPPVKPLPPDATKQGDGHTNKVAEVEFPDLKLQGISRRKNKTFAILNGKTLSAGDRIEGVMLLKIDTDSVTIEKAGLRRELYLLR